MTVLATSGPSAYWYLTRGSGVAALLLLTAAMVAGVASSARWRAPRWPRFVVSGLHRNLTLVAIAFVFIHVVTTIADGFAPIGLRDAFIPFLSPYRPLWLGLGALAFDLLLALVITSLLRARVGLRLWRGLHWLAYASWPVALFHALGTGSDARTGWLELLALACVGAVVLAVLWRVAAARGPGAVRVVGAGAAIGVALVLVGWYRGGPLRAGWATRSGTPATLLGTRVAARAGSVASARVAPTPQTAFSGRFSGTFTESGLEDGLVTIVVAGEARSADARLHLALRGEPLVGGGVQMLTSAVGFARGADPYTGSIVGLDGDRVAAAVRDAAGHALRLDLRLRINASAGSVTGVLAGQPGTGEGGGENG